MVEPDPDSSKTPISPQLQFSHHLLKPHPEPTLIIDAFTPPPPRLMLKKLIPSTLKAPKKMTTQTTLAKFTTALQHIYRFPIPSSSAPTTDPAAWTPPPASAGHKGRYLWTDAFGLLNFLTLYRETSSPAYLTYARNLATAVHGTLGRTRDGRSLLPGATPANPLGGGLRIGKEAEGGSDGDGQYHHYLTLWMFGLNRLSIATQEKSWNDQAIALAKAIHPAFVHERSSARPRMVWKMSMDLKRVLVGSEGNLDPVDGFVVFRLLQETDGAGSQVLENEIGQYERIVRTKWRGYGSSDPLDLGMTLWTAHWFGVGEGREEWAEALVRAAARDVGELFGEGYFERPVRRRLAFREFGTVMGMRCAMEVGQWDEKVERITGAWERAGVVPTPDESGAAGMNAEDELVPITLVMYAAALIPGGECDVLRIFCNGLCGFHDADRRSFSKGLPVRWMYVAGHHQRSNWTRLLCLLPEHVRLPGPPDTNLLPGRDCIQRKLRNSRNMFSVAQLH